MLDLDAPPGLERLLAQTHAGHGALWAELDSERARLDDLACRAGLRRDVVRRFVAAGLLADADETAAPGALYRTNECVTVGLLLEVVERLEALRLQSRPRQGAAWT
jgi:hypothetical protein